MKYDFNQAVDRSHNFSAKYDELARRFGREDLIPLWIADMDLKTAQPILDAIAQRNEQAIFGYTARPDSYWEAVCDWQQRRNGWTIDKSLISFGLGVVPVICTLVRELTHEKDQICFLSPVYSEFYDSVANWDRAPLTVKLNEEQGYYTIDYEKLEEALKQKPALFILCNPHNPVGRAWTLAELKKIGDLCLQYGVPILSDEIHSDLMLFGHRHIPMATVSPEIAAHTITCISATKTFNLAGLQACTTVFPNPEYKRLYDTFWQHMDVHRNNCFSLVAVEAAFREGEDWLEQLLRHLESNADYIERYLAENIPEIHFYKPECTYLLWLNCKGLGLEGDALVNFMIQEAHLALNDGRAFGTGGAGYMRMNIACPRSTLEKAMSQLKEAVNRHFRR